MDYDGGHELWSEDMNSRGGRELCSKSVNSGAGVTHAA
jgi:hypothetical protein